MVSAFDGDGLWIVGNHVIYALRRGGHGHPSLRLSKEAASGGAQPEFLQKNTTAIACLEGCAKPRRTYRPHFLDIPQTSDAASHS